MILEGKSLAFWDIKLVCSLEIWISSGFLFDLIGADCFFWVDFDILIWKSSEFVCVGLLITILLIFIINILTIPQETHWFDAIIHKTTPKRVVWSFWNRRQLFIVLNFLLFLYQKWHYRINPIIRNARRIELQQILVLLILHTMLYHLAINWAVRAPGIYHCLYYLLIFVLNLHWLISPSQSI